MARATATADTLRRALRSLADGKQAAIYLRFFKTAPGQYAEGDRFLGVKVPHIRVLAKQGAALPVAELVRLLRSPWHEERMLALLSLVGRYGRTDERERERIYRAYLANARHINNWDLVDVTAEHIVGAWLCDRDRTPLRRLAVSTSLWERRIAIMASFHFIKQGDPRETLRLAKLLLDDEHDLIHKAVGWMLREIGKRCDRDVLRAFLAMHRSRMPRTTLRYAIEHFSDRERRRWMSRDPA